MAMDVKKNAGQGRWRSSPHNRKRCPVHGCKLVVESGKGPVGYCYCPEPGCKESDKCSREWVSEGEDEIVGGAESAGRDEPDPVRVNETELTDGDGGTHGA